MDLLTIGASLAALIFGADSERSLGAFRLEFQRSIDAAQAATIKTIRDNIFSVIKTINSTIKDLNGRLARLEERADETATQIAGTQNLDVRLTRLEERADETATQIAGTQDLDVRLGRLEQRADERASQIAGTQKQSLEQTERIAAQLAGLEQNLMELSDRLSLVKQTIDGAILREQDTHNSIEAISSRVITTQQRVEELFPRQVLGEKTVKDLGTLIGFFIKRLKSVNANSTEIAMRLGDLESQFRSKLRQLEEHHSSILERKDGLATSKIEDLVEDATAKAADAAIPIAATTDGKNADGFERATTPGQESSKKTIVEEEGHADNSRADQHAT